MQTWESAKRVVIKVGSSTLTYEKGNINIRREEQLVKDMEEKLSRMKEIVNKYKQV